jgi:hypothetical protein
VERSDSWADGSVATGSLATERTGLNRQVGGTVVGATVGIMDPCEMGSATRSSDGSSRQVDGTVGRMGNAATSWVAATEAPARVGDSSSRTACGSVVLDLRATGLELESPRAMEWAIAVLQLESQSQPPAMPQEKKRRALATMTS